MFFVQLFEGRLALNPGLNLNQVSFSCVQKLKFSLVFLELPIINLQTKKLKLKCFLSFQILIQISH